MGSEELGDQRPGAEAIDLHISRRRIKTKTVHNHEKIIDLYGLCEVSYSTYFNPNTELPIINNFFS